MRRRRVDILHDDIQDVVKSTSKGLLGFLIKGLLSAIVKAILKMLQDKGWVDTSEDAII